MKWNNKTVTNNKTVKIYLSASVYIINISRSIYFCVGYRMFFLTICGQEKLLWPEENMVDSWFFTWKNISRKFPSFAD